MKAILAAAILVMVGLSSASAMAETIDISTLKCSDIASMKPEEAAMILAWIDGYLGGQADDTRLDIDRFNDNADAAAKACGDEPDTGILTVLKAADGEN
jgi:hypothetical protein